MLQTNPSGWSLPAKLATPTLLALMTLSGCGGSGGDAEPSDEAKAAEATGQAVAQTSQTQTDQPSPAAVVSEFLDGVRRGGAAADIGKLMTRAAREQYAAVGLVMQPIGAPNAKFEVTRSVQIEEGVLVNSLWTESDAAGNEVTYEVGWALKQEPEGWRVSGLILGEDPENPLVFNFESREDVLALKQMQEGPDAATEPDQQTASQEGFSMPDLN
jgi:hypothetical protein